MARTQRMQIPTERAALEAMLDDPARFGKVLDDPVLMKEYLGAYGRATLMDDASLTTVVKEQVQHHLFNELRNDSQGMKRLDLSNGGHPAGPGEFAGHPLAVDAEGFAEMDTALRERRGHIYNAALTTTTLGQPAGFGQNTVTRVRMLHMVAGVPQQSIEATLAEHPKFTVPTAAAGVAEGVTLGEYDSSTAGTVTLLKWGRFTDLTTESLIGTSAAGVTSMHQLGIARDLDKSLIDKAEADAGSAVAFEAGVPAAIRKRIHSVADATQADATDLVVLAHPDDAHLLEDVTPASGSDVGEGFSRFSGALVYVSSAVNTGFITVANLRVGARYFQARGVRLETDVNVKTGVITYATSTVGGYGSDLVSGYSEMQDVVTP